MRNLFTIDMKNYDRSWNVYHRTAVRAIIIKNGKIALIRSAKYHEYKFPGGGMEKGEDEKDTLIREIREETGMEADINTIREYGQTEEIEKYGPQEEKKIFRQISKYYFCNVTEKKLERELDDYEAEYGYKLEWTTIGDALENNLKITEKNAIPWLKRETSVLKILNEEL